MSLPSFETVRVDGQSRPPRVYVLEVRRRESPEQPPIAWLFVERVESYRKDERDDSVYEASIRISYELIGANPARNSGGRGYFCGSYSRGFSRDPLVSLTSPSTAKGAVSLDLPGLEGNRIGTYLLAQIVTWAKQWPGASVLPIELVEGQAHEENKARRNRFYEQFGLVFEYTDSGKRAGLSRPMPVQELTCEEADEAWKKNLRELDVRDYVGSIRRDNERLRFDLSAREQGLEMLRRDIARAEAQPVRWAARRLWWRIQLPVIATLVLLAVAGVLLLNRA